MAFTLQARDVTAMRSYTDAKYHHDQTEPNRDGDRCLSRNKGLTIEMVGEDVACAYNGNQVVTYHPDNTVSFRSCGWTSPSTGVFAARCIGERYAMQNSSLYLYVNGGFYLLDGLVVDLNKCEVVAFEKEQRKVLDKVQARELRAPMMPFIRDITRMAKFMDRLGGAEYYHDQLPESARNVSHHTWLEIARGMGMASEGDTNARETVTNWLLWQATQVSTRRRRGAWRGGSTESVQTVAQRVKYIIAQVMQSVYEDNRCWEYQDVPPGEIKKRDLY